MSQYTLSGLFRYPVKSLYGETFERLDIGPRGPLYDRHWMVVDAGGKFLTQRQLPRMTLIRTRLDATNDLYLAAPGMPELAVGPPSSQPVLVRVWGDEVTAVAASAPINAWLSEFLETDCRLVSLPDASRRPVDPHYASADDQVGFADGFPLLLISQGSLDELNSRLTSPVPMRRFRPNLVVSGCAAFAEDDWRRIRIGDILFEVVKPCSRCVIPTIDTETAERGREPLQTLMSYRKRDNKIYFGQNLIHRGQGALQIGMTVEVLA